MDNKDVKISYYPETGKGHSVARISFSDNLDLMLETERVMLRFDGNRMYFEKGKEGHGLKISKNGIQIWRIADKFAPLEGYYPLRYDIEKSMYFIDLDDKEPFTKDLKLGSRLGSVNQYTKHYGPQARQCEEEKVEVEEPKEIKFQEEPKISVPEKVTTNILLDKLIQSIDKKEYEDARALALSIKALFKN